MSCVESTVNQVVSKEHGGYWVTPLSVSLNLHVQVRIPALEDTGQFTVQRPHSRL